MRRSLCWLCWGLCLGPGRYLDSSTVLICRAWACRETTAKAGRYLECQACKENNKPVNTHACTTHPFGYCVSMLHNVLAGENIWNWNDWFFTLNVSSVCPCRFNVMIKLMGQTFDGLRFLASCRVDLYRVTFWSQSRAKILNVAQLFDIHSLTEYSE